MESIRSAEQYEEKKKRLDMLVNRYKWLVTSEYPLRDLKNKQDIFLTLYSKKGISKEEALKIENELQAISVQNMYINKAGIDGYEAILMSEIREATSAICAYEAGQRLYEKSPLDILKAYFNNDEEIKNDVQYRRAYNYSVLVGDVGIEEINLSLTPPEVILERMANQIDWAGIELITKEERKELEAEKNAKKEQMALVVAQKPSRAQEKVSEVVQDYVKSIGLVDLKGEKSGNVSNTVESSDIAIRENNDKHKGSRDKERAEKDSEEEISK